MTRHSLELWGGIECTLNRVGDCYHDQLKFAGHDARPDDLAAIASLGIRTLRYPVLWEEVAPRSLSRPQFGRSDARLRRLQAAGIEPIVGLLHHGSGPRYTSLLDAAFPRKLSTFAGLVARRYPWVHRFTPVNEPLTTARFSALYGHWYPHARDDRSFARALLNQVWGTVLAMQAIRREVPDAQLIQTEDLGWVRSTPDLAYQAAFENERRFLSLDLLLGRVTPQHPLHGYLLESGIGRQELELLADNPCPPDVVGLNYYVTGERYLDSRIGLYPAHVIGGNGRAVYADVEAVRVCPDGLRGPGALLIDAHARLGVPLAVTEAHLAGAHEDRALAVLRVVRGRTGSRRGSPAAGGHGLGSARLPRLGPPRYSRRVLVRSGCVRAARRRARGDALRWLSARGGGRHSAGRRWRLVA